ncbi:hypothetical protein BGZ91_010111 [Linnemannia elongata]|nr:hypothetical protein BGZ91_010111 [Linnemannia elongata]
MVPTGRSSILAKRRRRKEVEEWKEWREIEDRAEEDRLPQGIQDMEKESGNRSSNSNRCSGGGSIYAVKTEAEILNQLQNLGLLLNVEETLQEMDTDKNFRPLPALEKLSFSLPIMRRPEDELRSLFSSAFKRWRRQ